MDPQPTQTPPDTRPNEQENSHKWLIHIVRNEHNAEPPLLTVTKVIFLASVIIIPCFTFRKLSVLQKKLTDLHGMNIGQHHHLKAVSQVLAARRAENTRLISLLEEMREEVRALKAESRVLHAAQGQMEDRTMSNLTDNKRELGKLISQMVQSDAVRIEAANKLREELTTALCERDRTR